MASLSKPSPDKTAIREAIGALFAADAVIELRAFPKGRGKRTDAGYFDGAHRENIVDAAMRLNAQGSVYVTLNPIDPQLLGRYCNRVEAYAQATATDANVTRRRWLLIDLDPVRPKDTSATDAQVELARAKACNASLFLKAEGWPDPIEAESGNGVHLLYPLDLPNDAESRDLVKGALAGLAARVDDDAVKVDQSVYNAGRIVKLYGTVANKGDHTESAPWRVSRITWGIAGEPVTPDQLRQAIRGNGAQSPAQSALHKPIPVSVFDLYAFLERLGIPFEQDIHDGRERYKLERCPFNSDHGKGEAAILCWPSGKLGFKCQHGEL